MSKINEIFCFDPNDKKQLRDAFGIERDSEAYKDVVDFLRSKGGECTVEEIFRESKADDFHIYPMVIKMAIYDELEILEKSIFGAPVRVRLLI